MSRRVMRRGAGGGSGPPPTPQTLQETYDASTPPLIELSDALGSVQLNDNLLTAPQDLLLLNGAAQGSVGAHIVTDGSNVGVLVEDGTVNLNISPDRLSSVGTSLAIVESFDAGSTLSMRNGNGARVDLTTGGAGVTISGGATIGTAGDGDLYFEAGTNTGNIATATQSASIYNWTYASDGLAIGGDAGLISLLTGGSLSTVGVQILNSTDASNVGPGLIPGTGPTYIMNSVVSSATDFVEAGANNLSGGLIPPVSTLIGTQISGTGGGPGANTGRPVVLGAFGVSTDGVLPDVIVTSAETDSGGTATIGRIAIASGSFDPLVLVTTLPAGAIGIQAHTEVTASGGPAPTGGNGGSATLVAGQATDPTGTSGDVNAISDGATGTSGVARFGLLAGTGFGGPQDTIQATQQLDVFSVATDATGDFGLNLEVDASARTDGNPATGTGQLAIVNQVTTDGSNTNTVGGSIGDPNKPALLVTTRIRGQGSPSAQVSYFGSLGNNTDGKIGDVIVASIEDDSAGTATLGSVNLFTGLQSDLTIASADQISASCGSTLFLESRLDNIQATASIDVSLIAGNNVTSTVGDEYGLNATEFHDVNGDLTRTIDSLGDSLTPWRNGKADPMLGGYDVLLWTPTSCTFTPYLGRGGGCTMATASGDTGVLEGSANQLWMARRGKSRMRQMIIVDQVTGTDQKLRVGIRVEGAATDQSYFEFDAGTGEWRSIVVDHAGVNTDCTLAPITSSGSFERLDIIETDVVSGTDAGVIFLVDGVTLGIAQADDSPDLDELRGPFIESETTADSSANVIGRTEVWVSCEPSGQ